MTLELFLKGLLVLAMIGTVGALVFGIFQLFHDGKEASERSNKMMRYRIIFQVLATLVFSFLLFLQGR